MRALITGASSGIGRDIAKELAKRGYDLILVGRNENRLKAVGEEICKDYGIESLCITADLSVEEHLENLYKDVGDVDILVNNAGFGDYGKFDETSRLKDVDIIKTNIIALHTLTKWYLADMKKKNSGKILNVSSIAGFLPGPLMATYYSTKAYEIRLSEAIREELRRDNSRVQISVLCPGPVQTNFNKRANLGYSLKGLSSEYVAKYAVDKFLKGRFYIIPGLWVRLAVFFSPLVTRKTLGKWVYNIQKKKEDKWTYVPNGEENNEIKK